MRRSSSETAGSLRTTGTTGTTGTPGTTEASGAAGAAGIPYDGILFDFDGVLADTERQHHESWNRTLEPLGIQFTWEEYVKHCVGVADLPLARRMKLAEPEAAVAQKQAYFRAALEQHPPFLQPTLEVVRQVSKISRIAVVSSSYHSEVEPSLFRAAIHQFFEVVICGDDVQNLKPAPDIYLLAAHRLGLTHPLVVEDSDAGLAAGQAAGFEVLRVTVDRMPQQLRSHLGLNG